MIEPHDIASYCETQELRERAEKAETALRELHERLALAETARDAWQGNAAALEQRVTELDRQLQEWRQRAEVAEVTLRASRENPWRQRAERAESTVYRVAAAVAQIESVAKTASRDSLLAMAAAERVTEAVRALFMGALEQPGQRYVEAEAERRAAAALPIEARVAAAEASGTHDSRFVGPCPVSLSEHSRAYEYGDSPCRFCGAVPVTESDETP